MDRFQVLSLDGGGSRGLFAAAVLAAVEEDLNINIADHFDLIAGTSTGGIIALALGLGFRPRQIVDFYVKYSPSIFRNTLSARWLQHWLIRKYSPSPLERSLKETFQERLLGDSKKRLVIPSYELGSDDVYIFRTAHADRLKRDYKVPAWKVALATTAAPTFFPAFRGVDRLRLIDGGVWANNPAMVALVEAFGTLGMTLEQIHMLSVGSYEGVSKRPRYLNAGGRLPWSVKVADVLLRAGSLGVNNQARFLLGEKKFFRIDPKVPDEDVVLDAADRTDDLIGRARHYSRVLMPQISERFSNHIAPAFVPIHTTASKANV
jgi:patatin-like phospholipase/acyl hydrolase